MHVVSVVWYDAIKCILLDESYSLVFTIVHQRLTQVLLYDFTSLSISWLN